jgi:predicted DCC family thiol-disulfide oxidoreductase YuxK
VAFLTERTPRHRGAATISPRDGGIRESSREAVVGGFERTDVKASSAAIVELPSGRDLSGGAKMTGKPPILLYDGVCVLCSRSVTFVLKHEREASIRFVAIQSEEGAAMAAAHGVDPEQPDTFLFVEDGRAYRKSSAVITLFAHLRPPWSFARALRFCPTLLRDWLYDRVARNRYRLFGKREVCMAPTPELRERFALPASK